MPKRMMVPSFTRPRGYTIPPSRRMRLFLGIGVGVGRLARESVLLFLDARVGLDDLARPKFRGFEDRFRSSVPELLEIGALDVLELHLQHARLGPFAVLAEGDFADDCVERMAAYVI